MKKDYLSPEIELEDIGQIDVLVASIPYPGWTPDSTDSSI